MNSNSISALQSGFKVGSMRLKVTHINSPRTTSLKDLKAMDESDRRNVLFTWIDIIQDVGDLRHISRFMVNLMQAFRLGGGHGTLPLIRFTFNVKC